MKPWTPPRLPHNPQLVRGELYLANNGWSTSQTCVFEVQNGFTLDLTLLRRSLVLRYTQHYLASEGISIPLDEGFVHQYSACCGYALQQRRGRPTLVWCGKCGEEVGRHDEDWTRQRDSLFEHIEQLCSPHADNLLQASLWAHDAVALIREAQTAAEQLEP